MSNPPPTKMSSEKPERRMVVTPKSRRVRRKGVASSMVGATSWRRGNRMVASAGLRGRLEAIKEIMDWEPGFRKGGLMPAAAEIQNSRPAKGVMLLC